MRVGQKNTFVAAAMGVFFGMLAFYYSNYIAGDSKTGVAVVRAVQDIPAQTQLTVSMVEIDHVPEPFFREGTIREGELGGYIGRKVQEDVNEDDLLMRETFGN